MVQRDRSDCGWRDEQVTPGPRNAPRISGNSPRFDDPASDHADIAICTKKSTEAKPGALNAIQPKRQATRRQSQMTYLEIATQICNLISDKQKAYGNSFGRSGEIMKILYPDGISHSQMDDALALVRVIDKMFRIATSKNAYGESPWRDITGYAILSVARDESDGRTG